MCPGAKIIRHILHTLNMKRHEWRAHAWTYTTPSQPETQQHGKCCWMLVKPKTPAAVQKGKDVSTNHTVGGSVGSPSGHRLHRQMGRGFVRCPAATRCVFVFVCVADGNSECWVLAVKPQSFISGKQPSVSHTKVESVVEEGDNMHTFPREICRF